MLLCWCVLLLAVGVSLVLPVGAGLVGTGVAEEAGAGSSRQARLGGASPLLLFGWVDVVSFGFPLFSFETGGQPPNQLPCLSCPFRGCFPASFLPGFFLVPGSNPDCKHIAV